MTEQREMLYEGKAKRVYATDSAYLCVVEYKDDATAFNGEKKGSITGKGGLNNAISKLFMEMLEANGVDTHFVEQLDDTRQLVKRVEIIPLEVIVRNIAAGSLAKRLGLEEGTDLRSTVLEFCYKRDDLGDPILNDDHIETLQLATPEMLRKIRAMALSINELLVSHLKTRNVTLVDFKLEFGLTADGTLLLADEISPDTCRFWDSETREKLDKDRFRRDMGNVEEAYQEMLRRLGGVTA